MRAIIIIAVLLLAAILVGWIRFSRDGDQATVEFDGGEMRSDTQELMQEGRELMEQRPEVLKTDPQE